MHKTPLRACVDASSSLVDAVSATLPNTIRKFNALDFERSEEATYD